MDNGQWTIENCARHLQRLSLFLRKRIPGVAQAVTDKVQGEQSQGEGRGGIDDEPPVNANGVDLFGPAGDERTQTGLRRLYAQSQIAEKGFVQNNGGNGQGQIYDDHAIDVGQDVAQEDSRVAGPQDPAGIDKRPMAQREHLPAHDPRHGQPGNRPQPGEQAGKLQKPRPSRGQARRLHFFQDGVQGGDEHDDKNDGRHGIEHIDKTHHHRVPASAAITGGRAPQDADNQADRRADQADEQRNARAVANPAQQITPVDVGAEPMPGAGRLELRVGNRIGRMGQGRGQERRDAGPAEEGPNQNSQNQEGQNNGSGGGGPVAAEAAPGFLIGAEMFGPIHSAPWGPAG